MNIKRFTETPQRNGFGTQYDGTDGLSDGRSVDDMLAGLSEGNSLARAGCGLTSGTSLPDIGSGVCDLGETILGGPDGTGGGSGWGL